MRVFAITAADCPHAITLFPTLEQAAERLRLVVSSAPDYADLLDVAEIDLGSFEAAWDVESRTS